jgi:hypothetical protein
MCSSNIHGYSSEYRLKNSGHISSLSPTSEYYASPKMNSRFAFSHHPSHLQNTSASDMTNSSSGGGNNCQPNELWSTAPSAAAAAAAVLQSHHSNISNSHHHFGSSNSPISSATTMTTSPANSTNSTGSSGGSSGGGGGSGNAGCYSPSYLYPYAGAMWRHHYDTTLSRSHHYGKTTIIVKIHLTLSHLHFE